MRGLRVFLAAMSATVLVAGLVASAGAQSPEPPASDWAFVTGVEKEADCGEVTDDLCYTDVMDDPRVSGDARVTLDWECSPEAPGGNLCQMGGGVVVANEDGTWDGHWVGIIEPDGLHEIAAWYGGTGAYDGWSYLVFLSSGTAEEPLEAGVIFRIRGVVYRGDLPPSVALGD